MSAESYDASTGEFDVHAESSLTIPQELSVLVEAIDNGWAERAEAIAHKEQERLPKIHRSLLRAHYRLEGMRPHITSEKIGHTVDAATLARAREELGAVSLKNLHIMLQ